MSLKDLIKRDIDNVFMNTDEFCDNLVMQVNAYRMPIIGSLQQNLVQNNSGNGSALQSVSWSLYVKYPLTEDLNKLLNTGTRITINDQSYTVVDIADEMGVCRIGLTTHTTRR